MWSINRWLCAVTVAACLVMGCGGGVEVSEGGDDAGRDGVDFSYAGGVLLGETVVLSRNHIVGVSDRLLFSAEGKSATDMRVAARMSGDLRRKSYRVFHELVDAREAVVQYGLVGGSVRGVGDEEMCRSRVRGLGLRAEVDGDVGDVYLGLYEESIGQLPEQCDLMVRRALEDLVAYRVGSERLSEVEQRKSVGVVVGAGRSVVAVEAGVLDVVVEASGGHAASGRQHVDSHVAVSQVDAIDVYGSSEAARVVIRLSGPSRYEVGELLVDSFGGSSGGGVGARLYVDLVGTRRGQVAVGSHDGLVRRVRVGDRVDGVRVVLDLTRAVTSRVFYLPEPYRVVVDVGVVGGVVGGAGREVRRVVLDPGHGGKDPGSIGAGGLREKDVVLDIAHRVAPVLSREMGVVTMLTRDDDRYVTLEERAARANAFGADLFVSIHCNASEDPGSRGVQTYVLASSVDDVSGVVAGRENGASVGAGSLVGGVEVGDVSRRSVRFAGLLQRSMVVSLGGGYGGVVDGGVRSAGFFVLVGAQMPAVLSEVAFISNPGEESLLMSADYRRRLADGIVNAVRAYRDGL